MISRQKKFFILILFFLFCFTINISGEKNKKIITFWHQDSRPEQQPVWQKMADDFMKLHPDVKIRITVLPYEAYKQKISVVMQSKNPPDLFRSWGGGLMFQWAEAGLLRDITSEVKKWPSKIGKGAIGVYSYKGKTYGMPFDMGAIGFWYNKELFKKAGHSNPPKTWKEFLRVVKDLKRIGITPIALGNRDKWPGHFYWVYLAMRLGGKKAFDAAYSGEGSFKDGPFVKAGELLRQLVNLKAFQKNCIEADYEQQAALMGNGKAGMELMGRWAPDVQKSYSKSKKGIGDKLGFFPFPTVEGGKGKLTDTMGGGNGYIVGKNAPDETIEFLKHITSVKNNKLLAKEDSPMSIIPTVKGAGTVIKNPFKKQIHKLVAKAEYYQLYYDQYLPPATGKIFKDITKDLLAGKMTPEEVTVKLDDSFKEERR